MQQLKNYTLEELISLVNSKMIELGYATGSMRHFRECWNVLKNYATKHGEMYLSNELGMSLLKEHYNIEMYSANLSGYKNLIRRAVVLLLEYQISGSIYKRQPHKNHEFHPEYKNIAESYIEHLKNQGLKQGTIRNHHRFIERFTCYLISYDVKNISDIDINIVNQHLQTYVGYSKSYIAGNVQRLKSFFLYCFKNGLTSMDYSSCCPKLTCTKDKNIPKTFTVDEIERILKAVDRGNARGKRDYALILLAVKYGLRVSDIKTLSFSNIDFANNTISIIQEKTGKPLQFELLPDVGWAIIDYLKNGRPKSDSDRVFIRHVTPYSEFGYNDNLGYIIYRYGLMANIVNERQPKCSMHMLRYSLASNLLLQNTPIHVVSEILGHAQLNTSTIYTKIDIPQLSNCALEVPYETK